ncbi:MAG: site-2 protease family protein [Planctomycetota bacterium]|jgi:membrane-associated protease RseP (regulator of RpoE activity)
MLPVTPTQYDINFSIFGIPVRIHPLFWLIAAFISWAPGQLDLVVVGIACVFLSILVHELGHALSARYFGWPPHIVLHGMGGMAIYSPTFGHTRKRAIWISFAGPLAGFLLYGIARVVTDILLAAAAANQTWAIRLLEGGRDSPIAVALGMLLWINLSWGILNLMPVFPLDGGRICAELFNARHSVIGQRRTSVIGMVTAAALSAFFILAIRQWWGGLLFGSLAYDNYRQYQQLRSRRWQESR